MSQPFSLRVVLEKASDDLRQKVFSKLPSYAGFAWGNLGENDVQPLLQHLKTASEDEQRLVGIRMRQIHDLGSPAGTKVLLKAGAERKLTTLGADLMRLRNAYERAFWCLANHEALFDHPRVYAYTHSLPKDSRETRVGFPQGKVVVTKDIIAELICSIKEAYKKEAYKEEERAVLCSADHREHDGVHLIHAYPSDYVDEIDTYLSDGRLSSVSVTPPFHIVLYVDECDPCQGGCRQTRGSVRGFRTSGSRWFSAPEGRKENV